MERVWLSGFLIVLSIFDSRERKVPIALVNSGLLVALVCVSCRCMDNPTEWKWFASAAVLGMLPGVFLVGMAYITDKIGLGDGLVLMGVGMLVGYKECLVLICFSLFLMSIWCIGALCCKRANHNTRIPYIPFFMVVYITGLLV